MLGKKRKLGKKIGDLKVGETYTTTSKIEDKDLLLYLGITDDANPLYIQHDYASQTPFKRPLVPPVMLYGVVASTVSMHLPGPGSHIIEQQLSFPKAVYHYAQVKLTLEITNIDLEKHVVAIKVNGWNEEEDEVIRGTLEVCPAYEPESMNAQSLENFY